MIELSIYSPNYFFIPIDDSLLKEYSLGFSLGEVFKVKGHAIKTNADDLLINTKLDKLKSNIEEYMRGESNIEVGKFTKSRGVDLNGVYKILPYRVFDNRHYYDSTLTNVRSQNLTKHESIESNYYLSFKLSIADVCNFSHILITKQTSESHLFAGKLTNHCAPLYVYNEGNYYLSFLPVSTSNEKFSDILITKNVPENKIVKGKNSSHSAPLYIKKEVPND